jgi:hypothetical protein
MGLARTTRAFSLRLESRTAGMNQEPSAQDAQSAAGTGQTLSRVWTIELSFDMGWNHILLIIRLMFLISVQQSAPGAGAPKVTVNNSGEPRKHYMAQSPILKVSVVPRAKCPPFPKCISVEVLDDQWPC